MKANHIQPGHVERAQGRLTTFEIGQGGGLPVLFLHADSGRASQWTEIMGRIGQERRAVSFDARGHGESEPIADGDYSYEGRATDIADVVAARGLERFVLVAHSGGAAVALRYAVANPKLVAGLFLVDPPTDPRAIPKQVREGFVRDLAGPKSLEAQKAFYTSIAGDNVQVRDRVLADCEATAPAARAGVGKALAEWNPELTLNAWQGAIFILGSTANDNEHALYRLRPDVPHLVVPHAGHWLQLDQPDRVEQGLRAFLARVEQEAS